MYDTDIVGQMQPTRRKNHWVAIKLDDESPITVLEVNENKDNVEVVGWYRLDNRNLERIKRQAEREGGELLILTPKGAAASLSTLPSGLPSEGKGTEESAHPQENSTESAQTRVKNAERQTDTNPTEAQKKAPSRQKIAEWIDNSSEIPYETLTWNESEHRNVASSGNSRIIDLGDRKIVVIDINGFKMPFYCSSGHGGKVDVPAGKWYPFFGIGADGWMNKTKGAEITNYYGSGLLRSISEALDAKYGDVRNDESIPKAKASGTHIDFINQSVTLAENGKSNTFQRVRENIDKAIAGIEEVVKEREALADNAPLSLADLKESSESAERQTPASEGIFEMAERIANEEEAKRTRKALHKHNWRSGNPMKSDLTWHTLVMDDGKVNVGVYDNDGRVVDSLVGLTPQEFAEVREKNRLTETDLTYGYIERDDRKFDKARAAERKSKNVSQTREEAPAPIGKGAFGNIYDQFKGKVKAAFDFLMKHKSGDLLGVFHRDDTGDIDLVWGDERRGFKHIIEEHVNVKDPDFKDERDAITKIEDIINNGVITKQGEAKVVIEKDGYRVVISKNIDGRKKTWVLTSYDSTNGKGKKKRKEVR